MSTTVEPAETEAPAPSRWKRRGGRTGNAGIALSARGEPMVWMTGGALVISLLMIIGLLILIVYQGIGTFWPKPIYKITLRDGTVLMGEVAREESYALSESVVPTFAPVIADSAEKVLDGRPEVEVERELLRTGNFKLTNTHFHWVSDFAFEPDERVEPKWAVLVERIEWGRFYGFPEEFALRNVRTPRPDERELDAIVEFFKANEFSVPFELQEAVKKELAGVEQTLHEERLQNVKAFAGSLKPKAGHRVDAVLADGKAIPIDDVTGAEEVVEVQEVATGHEAAWAGFEEHHDAVRDRWREQVHLRKHENGAVDRELEAARQAVRIEEIETGAPLLQPLRSIVAIGFELQELEDAIRKQQDVVKSVANRFGEDSVLTIAGRKVLEGLEQGNRQLREDAKQRKSKLEAKIAEAPDSAQASVDKWFEMNDWATGERKRIDARIDELGRQNDRFELRMKTAQGQDRELALSEVVRAYPANQITGGEKLSIYFSRWMEFLTDDPREANSEGGVFPAIWGTVAMTLIMSLAVVPFGVLAALYLREYAKPGLIVSAVRISINNLAGVPSIVFGVFGLGFFCYRVGRFLDGGAANAEFAPWPGPTWFMMLGFLAVFSVTAFIMSISSLDLDHSSKTRWQRFAGSCGGILWLVSTILFVIMIVKMPFFHGFYRGSLPNPTFGKGGLMWAALTLALLTLPVVIVATEEALAAVPNSMREGSYGCGASKWQTIKRIVLPRAMPGIMTGMILSMARGAGEVAPLMFVGAVKLAPELPVDGIAPFIHPDRSFMHLGFHIFDVAFQSQNSEAAKPMVYTTTLLLIVIITFLNLAAMWLRNRLSRKFRADRF